MAPPWVENAKEIKNRKKELKEHRNLRIPMQFRKPPIYNDDEESDDEEPYEAIWPTTDEEKLKEFSPLTEHLNTVANEQSTDESSPGDDDEEGISTSHPNHMQITGKCRQPELKSCRRELQAFNRFHKLRKRSGTGATTSAINDSPVESGFSSTAEFLDNVKMVVNEENLSLEDKIDRKTFYSHLREAVEQFSASKKRALIEVQCNPSDQAVHNSLKNASMSLTARYSSEFLISLFKSPPQFGENLKPFVIVAPWIHSILAFWIRNDIDDMAWISANTAPDPENKVIVLVKEESGEISIISGKTTTLDVKLAQFKNHLPGLWQWPKTAEDPLKVGQRHRIRQESTGATTSAINDSPVESGFSSTAEFLDNVKMVVNEENLSLEDKIDRKTFYSHLREAVEQFSASKKRALIEVQCNPSDQAVHNSLKNASMSLTARYSSEFLISLFKSPPQFGENLKPFVIVAPWIHSILAFWIRNDIDDMAWISANTAPDPENKVIVLVKEESGEISIISGKTTTLDVKLAQFKNHLPGLWQWPKTAEDPLKVGQRHRIRQETRGYLRPASNDEVAQVFPKNVGTRHSAALGATQITKCPIMVVSEERGTVSICQREMKKVIKTGVKKQEFMGTLKKILSK